MLTATVVPVQAQRRVVHYLPKYEQEPYHFGFLLAYNSMMYTIKTVKDYQNIPLPASSWLYGEGYSPNNTQSLSVYNIETEQVPGFTVGIIGSKRMGRYFDLRLIPSLSFSERKIDYSILVKSIDGGEVILPCNKSIFTTFIELPLNIKYRSKRYNNIGAYVFGGINPKIDLTSQKKFIIQIEETDTQGNTIIDPNTGEPKLKDVVNNLSTKRFDCAAELGAGFDIYNQWFKMGIEVKMSYGLIDVVKNDAYIYTAPINKLHNKLFQFSLLFE